MFDGVVGGVVGTSGRLNSELAWCSFSVMLKVRAGLSMCDEETTATPGVVMGSE